MPYVMDLAVGTCGLVLGRDGVVHLLLRDSCNRQSDLSEHGWLAWDWLSKVTGYSTRILICPSKGINKCEACRLYSQGPYHTSTLVAGLLEGPGILYSKLL
jgi:hypothetical protein